MVRIEHDPKWLEPDRTEIVLKAKCQHCGQWGEARKPCNYCGAPIDPAPEFDMIEFREFGREKPYFIQGHKRPSPTKGGVIYK